MYGRIVHVVVQRGKRVVLAVQEYYGPTQQSAPAVKLDSEESATLMA